MAFTAEIVNAAIAIIKRAVVIVKGDRLKIICYAVEIKSANEAFGLLKESVLFQSIGGLTHYS
ncbi:MAG TPA: hypothetical protein VGC97_18285 [Pyrinomonadaceae bacterium]